MAFVGEFDYVPCDDCEDISPTQPPFIQNVVPTPGTALLPYDIVQFDVIDSDTLFRQLIVYISYPNLKDVEVIHTGTAFSHMFVNSVRSNILNGYHYVISRTKAWPDAYIRITIDAIDTTGQSN